MHRGRHWSRASLASILQGIIILSALLPYSLSPASAQPSSTFGSSAPAKYPLLFGSSGNVEINIPKPGIAVRIEIPREFLEPGGVPIPENDTSFVTSNIRNDYYYYNLVDESRHWTYDSHDNASDGPCFKPNFSYYDPNAPYCLEIWNYLNSPLLNQPEFNVSLLPTQTFDYTYLVGVDYCQLPNLDKFVFGCFSAPKFVMLHNLVSPALAGLYNFTLSVADRTNILGYPDFVHAWNTTLFVPVSMAYNAGSIAGSVCDAGSGPPFCSNPIQGKGIVYAMQCPSGSPCSLTTASIVARAYINQSLCVLGNCGRFSLTGLAPGSYLVEGSAGVDRGVAYSLTPLGYPTPSIVSVSANSQTVIQLPLRRAPLVCGMINYLNTELNPIPSLAGQSYLKEAGFDPYINLNITVEGTDPFGHVFRFQGVSNGTTSDSFTLMTGVGVKYVGTDPYGTEFAGLPAPDDVGPGGYALTVSVWVSGYIQLTTEYATVSQSPGTLIPACAPPNQPTVSPNPVRMRMGGIISGTLQFCNTLQGCGLEPPDTAEALTGALFGGNILVEAFDATGLLRGVTVINGTLPDGTAPYAGSTSLRFYITGFSEYYNHSLSGVWHTYAPDYGHDSGLPDGQYSLSIFVRGYELMSTNPPSISIINGSDQTVSADMTRGGAFEVSVGSYDNRFGTRAIQARLPWRFLNSSIPVVARVYFSGPTGIVGYTENIMVSGTNLANGVGLYSFTVLFSGQNWSLREIWFYGLIPTYVGNDTYTINAYTLGYVPQNPGGVSSQNYLVNVMQTSIVLFVGNEADISVPLFSGPQSLTQTPEYDHAIGQVFLGSLSGAETANLTAGVPTLGFEIFGFGAMELGNSTECQTNVLYRGLLSLCGQGHFFYVGPDGTPYYDYGLDVGNYTAQLPEFGFTAHFLQVLTPPVISFTDLFLESGVTLQAIQMARVIEASPSVVEGWTGFPTYVAPLSWAQVQATNSSYYRSVSTLDGDYDGVNALFLPSGAYNVTFTDVQYQSQTVTIALQWGGSYPLTPTPLCPVGSTC